MADKKIQNLTALVTQAATDLYETSANGTGSFKETRLQMASYIGNANKAKTITLKTTSSTLTAAQITGTGKNGSIFLCSPTNSLQIYTIDAASTIYSALGSPPIDTTIDVSLVNLTEFVVNLTKTDPNLLISGLPSVAIGPYQTFDLKFMVTRISPSVQITISGGQSDGLINNIPNLIVISNSGSDASGIGTMERPYATGTYAASQAIVGQSTLLFTPGSYSGDIELPASIGIVGFGDQLSVLTGNITVDNTSWLATTSPHLEISDIGLTGTVTLVPTADRTGSVIRLNGVLLPSGSTIGQVESVFIGNGSKANNLTIRGGQDIQISGLGITGSLTQNDGDANWGPTCFINDTLISTLNMVNVNAVQLLSVTAFNCPNLSNGGTLNYDDGSGGGGYLTAYVDAISYPTTINDIQGAGVSITLLPSIFRTNFLYTNQIKVEDTVLSRVIPHSYNTNSGTTVSAGDLMDGAITVNPSAAQTIGFDSAANLVTRYGIRFGTPIEANISFVTTYNNESAFDSVITAGAGTSFAVSGATTHVQPKTSVTFVFVRIGSTFVIYGGLNGAGNQTISGTGTFGALTSDYLNGSTMDLRLNPSASGQTIFVGHDLASTVVTIGAGSTATDFEVRNVASSKFHVANAGVVTTLNNTLDDGSGKATITGHTVLTTSDSTGTVNRGYDGTYINPPAAITGNSVVLSAANVASGALIFNNATVAQAVQFPTASDFDAEVKSNFGGNAIPTSQSYLVVVANQSATATITFSGNTNFAITGLASAVLLPLARATFRIGKSAGTPAYVAFG